MGKSQRTKGATYEREVCAAITPVVGYKVERHIGQARDGGNDITVRPLVIECKRRKTLGTVEKWLQQAKIAAETKHKGSGLIPTVIARSDGGKSLVIMELDNFLGLIEDTLRSTYTDGEVE